MLHSRRGNGAPDSLLQAILQGRALLKSLLPGQEGSARAHDSQAVHEALQLAPQGPRLARAFPPAEEGGRQVALRQQRD